MIELWSLFILCWMTLVLSAPTEFFNYVIEDSLMPLMKFNLELRMNSFEMIQVNRRWNYREIDNLELTGAGKWQLSIVPRTSSNSFSVQLTCSPCPVDESLFPSYAEIHLKARKKNSAETLQKASVLSLDSEQNVFSTNILTEEELAQLKGPFEISVTVFGRSLIFGPLMEEQLRLKYQSKRHGFEFGLKMYQLYLEHPEQTSDMEISVCDERIPVSRFILLAQCKLILFLVNSRFNAFSTRV